MYSLEGHLSIADIYRDISRRIFAELKEEQPDFSSHRQKVRRQIIDFLHWVERGKVVGPNGQLLTVGPVFLTSIHDYTSRPTLFSSVTGLVGNEWPSIRREMEKGLPLWKRHLFEPLTYVRDATFIVFLLLMMFGSAVVSFSLLEGFRTYLGFSTTDETSTQMFSIGFWIRAFVPFALVLLFFSLWAIGLARRSDSSQQGSIRDLHGFALVFEEARYKEYLNIVVDDEKTEPKNAEKAVARQIVDAFDKGEKFTRSDYFDLKTSQGMGARSFGRAWERAREERPKLGRPGRRASD